MILKKCLLGMAVLALLAFSAQAFAQSSSTITGTVADENGGVMPGVKVTVTNESTNVKQELTTNSAGVYVASLPTGSYTVIAEMTGFATQTKRQVNLGTSSQLRLNCDDG